MPRKRQGSLAAAAAAAAAIGAALLAPTAGRAVGDAALFDFAQLVYAGAWNPRPTAARRLAWEVRKRTSVETRLDPSQVRLRARDAFRTPFLYVAGDRAFDAWPERDAETLRRFVTYGGMVLVDDASGGADDGFDRSVRREIARALPGATLAPVPDDHVLFRSFYLVPRPVGRVEGPPHLLAVERDGRLAIVYARHDLGGAWARDDFGNWEHAVVPGGEAQRERAVRLGVNVVLYALCLDYKSDQVHVPFLLKRRRAPRP